VSPVSSPVQAPNQVPPSASPPPAQFVGGQQQQQPQPPQQPQSPPPQQQAHPQTQQQPQQSIASSKGSRPQSASTTNFVAELPADLGNLNIADDSKTPASTNSPSQYQAYHPPGQASPAPGFAIPRRAVSTSSLPLADPWRIADPSTELPTREFYILADLLFDGLDRGYEPANTGLVEASKMLASWRAQQLPDEVARKSEASSHIQCS
jgi:hypothetical protein